MTETDKTYFSIWLENDNNFVLIKPIYWLEAQAEAEPGSFVWFCDFVILWIKCTV